MNSTYAVEAFIEEQMHEGKSGTLEELVEGAKLERLNKN